MTALRPAPFSPRHRTIAQVCLATAAVALFCVMIPVHSVLYGTETLVAALLAVGMCAAPLLVISWPRLAILLFCLSAVAQPLVVDEHRDLSWPWPWSVPAMLTFALFILVATLLHGWRTGLVPWTIAMMGSLAAPLVTSHAGDRGAAGTDLIVTASVASAALVLALLLAGRIRLGHELTRERELSAAEQSRRVLVEERSRIARELHDVVAHSMSLIQVQASTARYRLPGLSAEAVAELEDIASTARGSLTEMRRLLGVLRTEDQEPQLAPQQGIGDIPALVATIRRAGAHIDLRMDPPPGALPSAVQIAAFRITQEALSNAVRHSPGSSIEVVQGFRHGAVTIRIRNGRPDPTITGSPPAGAGHGVRGMRERVALLHGTLAAGPDPDGGWTVSAVLPWTSDEVEAP